MTSAADVLRVARSQLGYTETGANQTRYWSDLDPVMQGQPWCAVYVSWVFIHAGLRLPDMGRAYGFVYCPSAVAYAKAHSMWDTSGRYAPGDIVIYGGGAHTGIVVSDDGNTMTVWEGNTSSDDQGSQTNGGQVALRHRTHGAWVDGVIKTSRWLTTSQSQSKPTPAAHPPAPPKETTMKPWFFRAKTGAIVIVGPTGARVLTPQQWQTWHGLGYQLEANMAAMEATPYASLVASLGGIVK